MKFKLNSKTSIIIIVVAIIVIGALVATFVKKKPSVADAQKQQIEYINKAEANQPIMDVINGLVNYHVQDFKSLSAEQQNKAFLDVFVNYAPVLQPLFAKYTSQVDKVGALPFAVYSLAIAYDGAGDFIKTNFPNISHFQGINTSFQLGDAYKAKTITSEDVDNLLKACQKFNNFNFTDLNKNDVKSFVDFGYGLMVGNIDRHLNSLCNAATNLK